MSEQQYKKWNIIVGWIAFAIALITYMLTVEPTASFWDAGEYISTSAKLQVGHPPGAPLFQMIGAFFAWFAMEPEQVALMVNHMSVFASAFTILFMFWTITQFVKKFVIKEGELTMGKAQAILGSGLVGALAFTFTDSFWFNAVETEVYAMASFMMALLLYLGLRWEQDMHTPRGNKWLILIAFLIGCTFGIQFMGMLAIPSIGLIYFFKNYKDYDLKTFLIANVAVVVILMIIYRFMLTTILTIFSGLEVFFVNTIGLPFNSGTIITGLLFIGLFYYGLNYTRKKKWVHLNTAVLCFLFMCVGFSSWLMIPIRANAQVVINENNPASARELLAYYNREQYPSVGIVYGPMYTELYALVDDDNQYVDDKPKYEQDKKLGKYVVVNDWKDARQNYDDRHKGFLPRMWSSEHAVNYMVHAGVPEFKLKPEYRFEPNARKAVDQFLAAYDAGEVDYEGYHNFLRQMERYIDIEKPGFFQNMKFMLQYQLGYMYWRYFMWNFAGRQNDIQGKYDMQNGNWLSGIPFIDENISNVQPQDNLPSDVLNNKGRNTYFMLPLLLGVIGLVFHFKKSKSDWWVLLVFFLFTGIAIQIYTNIRPYEPRERDYSLVGSFYIFAIWIGIGVYALFDQLKNIVPQKILAPLLTVALLGIPALMASQNWDDHDRSGRYTAQSMPKSYLDSLEENAIIFTIGDNDTFALWYAQEIEGYRTDVRVINTSLLYTDWYIDQMKRAAYESKPIPSQLTHEQYRYGTRDQILHQPLTEEAWSIQRFMSWVQDDDPRKQYGEILKRQAQEFEFDLDAIPSAQKSMVYYPTRNIYIPVDKEAAVRNGAVSPEDADEIVDTINIRLPGSITKNQLLMLDIVANNNWERPIYFSGGSFDAKEYIWMKDYLQLDGMAYKLVPIKTPVDSSNPFEMGRVNADVIYKNIKKWTWGNSEREDIYHDPETRRNSITYRSNMARAMEKLLEEGKTQEAKEVIDLAVNKMPIEYFGYYVFVEPFADGYYKVGEKEKARELLTKIIGKYQESLIYYSGLEPEQQIAFGEDIFSDIEYYRRLVLVMVENGDDEAAERALLEFREYAKLFYPDEEAPQIPPIESQVPEDAPVEINDSVADDTIN
ncbi:DUF2723 domain-containing protein [Spongiivirga sp. MCCC 1A20706]|uniref:protein O-mannosyl-transferase family n=1 Tax=Spongiivirga sp. MCCC 1A20706 TaxID=3160963 RepID=UPI003977DC88